MSPSYRSVNGGGGGVNGKNFIEHQVSKLDTLVGVAIKYGVEVADLKKLNGLATDLQMFALKTLLIPLPGRHPPSAVSSSPNGSSSSSSGENPSEKTIQNKLKFNFLESFEMSRLETKPLRMFPVAGNVQNGCDLDTNNISTRGMEMAVYRTETPDYLTESLQPKNHPTSVPFFLNLKARTSSTGFLSENDAEIDYVPLADVGDGDGEKSNEKSVRRRQKAESDSTVMTPEKLFKIDNGVASDSSANGKRLSMRGKSSSKSSLGSETEQTWLNSFPVGLGDSIITDGLLSVRKSSSSPSFLDQERNSSSVWATPKWNLKQDLQSLSTAAINIPIFDGLPKPISGRKSKAALD